MKRIVFLAMPLFGMMAFAQVGINTETPNATLDVKSRTNNGSKVLELQNSQETKLVSVLDNGNMGIGEINPTEKLHINGKIRIVDGTQAEGKVLISDANGVARWGDNNGSNINNLVKRAKGITITCRNINSFSFIGNTTFYCKNNIMYAQGARTSSNNSVYIGTAVVRENQIVIPNDITEEIKYNDFTEEGEQHFYYTDNKVLYIGE